MLVEQVHTLMNKPGVRVALYTTTIILLLLLLLHPSSTVIPAAPITSFITHKRFKSLLIIRNNVKISLSLMTVDTMKASLSFKVFGVMCTASGAHIWARRVHRDYVL